MGVFFLVVFVAVVVYFFASSKTRRDTAIESRVQKMIRGNVDFASFSDLYFEAAKSYAVSKGATAADDQSASAKVVVNGTVYFVVFTRQRDGGTSISVDTEKNMERTFDKLFSFDKTKEQG